MRSFFRTAFMALILVTLFATAHAIPYDIIEAAKRGDEHAVRKLLEADADLVRARDARGFTPLHWAGIRAHWHVFTLLLEADAPVNAVGGDGGTPLHWACHHDKPGLIGALLDRGANCELANQWGRVPLHVAARRGCLDVAELLIARGAELEAATREGWTPLHVAHKAGQPAMMDLLLTAGADPEAEDSEGKRPRDMTFTRPSASEMAPEALDEFTGIFDLGGGHAFKIWREGDGLRIREFAPDGLYPVGPIAADEFFCVQEPWRVSFKRDPEERIAAVEVDFLRRTVRGEKRAQARYVGSQACRECHLNAAGGNQYMQWVRSRHAGAYWRLATDWAKLLAQFRPHYRDIGEPIVEDRCLLCHVSSAQEPDALHEASYRVEEGIGCETCHGPGSLYMDPDVMGEHEAFLAAGGVIPGEATCLKCHRNPDRFDFATWWPKVEHGTSPDAGH